MLCFGALPFLFCMYLDYIKAILSIRIALDCQHSLTELELSAKASRM